MSEPLHLPSFRRPLSNPTAAAESPHRAGGGAQASAGSTRRRWRSRAGIFTLAPVLLVASCTRGSGQSGSVPRGISEFEGLDVGGSFDVRVTLGSPAHLEITGDDNIISQVTTEVRGTTLYIELPSRVILDLPLRVDLTTPHLEDLHASGASSVRVEGLSGSEFELDASGASTVVLKGEVATLDAEVSGASTVKAQGLKTRKAEVDSSGASNVEVRATEELDAKASGASAVRYYGSPARVSPDSSGSSSIEAVD